MRFSSSRRLRLVALALGCIAGAILVALLLNAQTASQPSNPALSTAQAEATISATIANLLDIPLYPGAQDVKGDPLNDSIDRYAHTSFTVTAPRDDVLIFYEKELLAKGWRPDDRQLDYAPIEAIRRFRWFDSSGISPHALVMSVYMTKSDDGDPLVQIDRDKWPDIYFLPLYPDASNVMRTDMVVVPDVWHVITTTYSTSTDRLMIEDYYTQIIVGIGCEPFTPGRPYNVIASPSDLSDFGFACAIRSGPQQDLNYGLTLKLTPKEGNHTDVEMVASGFDAGDRSKP
jgi:hypothetical protein